MPQDFRIVDGMAPVREALVGVYHGRKVGNRASAMKTDMKS